MKCLIEKRKKKIKKMMSRNKKRKKGKRKKKRIKWFESVLSNKCVRIIK